MHTPDWPPHEHVLLYLSFDEGAGQTAASPGTWGDAVLGSKPVPESTDPRWCTGIRGNAMRFDGKDDFLTVPGVDQVRLDEFTIEAWVRPTGTSREIVVDYGGHSWGFAFAKAWHGVYLSIGHPPKGTRVQSTQFTVTISHWNHIAATLRDREVMLYVNGRLVKQQTVEPTMHTGPRGWPLLIGKVRSGHYHVTGVLDELLILDSARTAEQVFGDMVASMQRDPTAREQQ